MEEEENKNGETKQAYSEPQFSLKIYYISKTVWLVKGMAAIMMTNSNNDWVY